MPRRKAVAAARESDPSPPPPATFLDVYEVARRLSVSPSTVFRMVRRGDLFPPVHFGPGMTRWRTDDWMVWYASRSSPEARR